MTARVVERRRDPKRRAAVDVALSLAELNAGWGDYDRALEHLASAEQLIGGVDVDRFEHQRDDWIEAAAAPPPTAGLGSGPAAGPAARSAP